MRRAKVVIVAALAIPLSGCLFSGKPKIVAAAPAPPVPPAPALPPEPVSIPQTDVYLPPPQPVNRAALATVPPEETSLPVTPKPAAPPPARTVHAAPPPQPKAPEPAETPAPEPRPPIQEVLPADVEKQFEASAHKHQADTRALLEETQKRRRLTVNERRVIADINQFLKQSDQAEKDKDMRSADRLAERAYILAKELQGGK
jgi:hypothetical protein